jgi:hypothetical protein
MDIYICIYILIFIYLHIYRQSKEGREDNEEDDDVNDVSVDSSKSYTKNNAPKPPSFDGINSTKSNGFGNSTGNNGFGNSSSPFKHNDNDIGRKTAPVPVSRQAPIDFLNDSESLLEFSTSPVLVPSHLPIAAKSSNVRDMNMLYISRYFIFLVMHFWLSLCVYVAYEE